MDPIAFTFHSATLPDNKRYCQDFMVDAKDHFLKEFKHVADSSNSGVESEYFSYPLRGQGCLSARVITPQGRGVFFVKISSLAKNDLPTTL